MLKVLIIDDEKPARQLLVELLKNKNDLEIIGEASNGFEALKQINSLNPELIFLDIQMPKINGFELLEILDQPPLVIFTTAYSEYAIKAFEMNAIDYLLKPIEESRLEMAINKVLNSRTGRPDIQKLSENRLSEKEKLEKIVVKTGNQIHILPIDDIERIEAYDDYVKIHSMDKYYLKKMTMKFLENKLPNDQFIRIHRSHILNSNHLQKLEAMGKESHLAILKNGDKIPVSSSGYHLLKEILGF
ncbi:LytTR family transcriptional regulator DNA-binding domain-containing protein [Hyphobacterium sp. CCMP332]|nr:LytTR family transcriptional regulator DNA-binding domain-containing protein [Hyphobacterium sp. CCMP332]